MDLDRRLRHLGRRAGFGSTDASGATVDEAVARLLSTPTPVLARPIELDQADAPKWLQINRIQEYWFDRMTSGLSPLAEKMTLFWHGLFTTSNAKLYSPPQVWEQHELFHTMSLGNTRALVHAMALQPAMLNYLDNTANTKVAPQENFARELWELFLLGPGNYTQADVVASARAWTGYSTDPDPTGDRTRFVFRASDHDDGLKTLLGATASFDGPGVIDQTFDGPSASAVASHLAQRLCRFFTGGSPSTALVAAVAGAWQSAWEVRDALGALFRHPDFYADDNELALVKSPTQFMASAFRGAHIRASQCPPSWFATSMGEELFAPPDVSGWKGDEAWLSASSYYGKSAFTQHFAYIAERAGFLAETVSMTTADAVRHAAEVLDLADVSASTRHCVERWLDAERSARGWAVVRYLIIVMLLSPEFQLS